MMDAGGLYASKDFLTEDGRRVTTGFGHCPGSGGGMVLPREVTFSAELDQLLFTPLPELAALRNPSALANISSTQLQPNRPLKLVSSNQTEVRQRSFLAIFDINAIILPRQARDKHRENSKKDGVSHR